MSLSFCFHSISRSALASFMPASEAWTTPQEAAPPTGTHYPSKLFPKQKITHNYFMPGYYGLLARRPL